MDDGYDGYREAEERIQQALERGAVTLDLSKLELTAVPSEITQLTALQELDLSENRLMAVPPEITQLITLQSLNLGNDYGDGNEISELPPEIGQLTALRTLNLDSIGLTAVPPEIGQLTALETLYLGGNELTAVPPEIGQLTQLQKLRLNQNELTAVPPEIGQLTGLQLLDLNRNELTAVPPEIRQLTRLRELYLDGNQLTTVPEWLTQMPQLKYLFINRNPIAKPPPELLAEALVRGMAVDLDAVRRYYAQLAKEGEAYFYEAKLLLIGEGGAGKTSLARKLLNTANQLPPPEDSTKGIDILHWQFSVPPDPILSNPDQSNPDQQYTANIWDFGGQSIYKNTHQFFLSKRSVYVLLTDTRRESGNFYDWLRMQETFGDDSPVLLLKNKNRSHGNECIIENLPHLRERFPNLKEVVEVDLNNVPNEKGWNPLLGYLQEHLLALDHIGQSRPKTWVAVRHALDEDERDSISRRQFLTLCAEHGIVDKQGVVNEANALQLSDYLHHVGDILHFQDDPILSELIILNTTWALDAVYRVLDNKEIIAEHGRFTLHQLQALWHEAKYDNHRHHLLRLMENFRLCYKLNNLADTYIAPQLLQTDAPDLTGLQPMVAQNLTGLDDILQLRYRYPLFMPRGILSRAIVALHHRIEDQELTWRFGVILCDQYARAELLELRGEREIRIRVSGTLKRDLLMEIVRALEELHSGFSAKLQYEKLIPCNCKTCAPSKKPHFFRLDKLLEKLSHSKTTVDCDNYPYTEMQIPHLIGDIIPQAKAGDKYVLVNGDYINVGDIKDASGVGIGRGASATTTQS